MSSKKYTVAVDFDGVIHRYDTPFIAPEVIPDMPVDGVIDWLNEISKKFQVVIHTTRAQTIEGEQAVREYLQQEGYEEANHVEITRIKPPALIYIDDRAYRFEGDNFPTVQEIHQMKPWHKSKENHGS